MQHKTRTEQSAKGSRIKGKGKRQQATGCEQGKQDATKGATVITNKGSMFKQTT